MPISCRRVVKGVWRHWLQVPVGARHDEQCVCVCGGQAIYPGVVHGDWSKQSRASIVFVARALAAAVCAFLRDGRQRREVNFRLLCAVSPGHKLPTAPPLLATTTDRLTFWTPLRPCVYQPSPPPPPPPPRHLQHPPSPAASCSPRCRHEHSDSQQSAGCSASLPRSSPATLPLW